MPEPGTALRDDITNSDRDVYAPKVKDEPTAPKDKEAAEKARLERKLARKIRGFVARSDAREEQRRRDDRIGGNIYFSNHWQVRVGKRRAALTVNVAKALMDDRIALVTKGRPVPVVEMADDSGDEAGIRLMRAIIGQWWDDEEMDAKIDHVMYLSGCTRTAAIKAAWDPAGNGGAGAIISSVLPGWRLIIDPRTSNRKRLAFAGDRVPMPRWRAMQLHPSAAEKIRDAAGAIEDKGASGGSATSPLDDQFETGGGNLRGAGVLTVNGVPTLTAEGELSPSEQDAKGMVEVCEVYWVDPAMVTREVPKKDDVTGEVIRKPKIGEDGMPVFKELEREDVDTGDGDSIDMPRYELVLEDELEEQDVREYPFYRRTTVLFPDETVLDDKAWDFPLPYAYFSDGQPLEGLWTRGPLYECRSLQTDLNVSMSILTDNMRFGSMRAGVVYDGADLEQNILSISPGDVLRVRGPKGSFEWLQFPTVDQSWFTKFEFNVKMMRLLLGLDGVMSGQAQGRVDSGQAYDTFTDISGARLGKTGTRMERSICDLAQIVGAIAQEAYTEKHAVRVEQQTGRPTYERITPGSLRGQFRFKVVTGQSLAWNESSVRSRLKDDLHDGLIDKVGYWQRTNYPEWQEIKARMEREPAQLQPPPPPRTRRTQPTPPKAGGKK